MVLVEHAEASGDGGIELANPGNVRAHFMTFVTYFRIRTFEQSGRSRCISGSRLRSLFFVELGALMIVAATRAHLLFHRVAQDGRDLPLDSAFLRGPRCKTRACRDQGLLEAL
jgi:hypothetical protein